MEYEIPDEGEDILFDASTNPSLKPDEEELARQRAVRRKEKHAPQKAELIPEEEDAL
jgi:hypothetical protein